MAVEAITLPEQSQLAIRRTLGVAFAVLVALIVGLGGLSAVIGIHGAVIAPGELSVASEVKKVQHPTGGVVADIRVRDGSQVKAGDVLLALDPTVASANATIVGGAVDALLAQQARLEAERDSRGLRLPPELLARRGEPGVAQVIGDETRLFNLRTAERAGQKAQLRERQAQLQQEIAGHQTEMAARRRQIELIQQELVGVRKLYEQNLVPLTRLNGLERAAVQLEGEVGRLGAAVAEARGRIAEIGVQLVQVEQASRSESGAQLNQVQARLAELRQRKVTADQDFRRVLIRSPQSGIVDRPAIHTIGGVIAPAEPILFVVPDKDALRVEARVRPVDVDQVKAGQEAVVRFAAFNQRSTPELRGTVARVSAESRTDERTGVSFYVAVIEVAPETLARLGSLKLTPGMPVETFIQTEKRTLLSYVTRPLGDQLNRAFRED